MNVMQRNALTALLLAVIPSMATPVLAESSDANLEVLQIRATGSSNALTPAFAPDRHRYFVKVNSDISAIQIRAGAWVSGSSVTINGTTSRYLSWYRGDLHTGDNDFDVSVTSTDGTQTSHYHIDVQCEDVGAITAAFKRFSLDDNESGLSMPYRLFVPERLDASAKYPLVVFLHGGGQNGTDNQQQLEKTEGAVIWAKPDEQARRPAFVLAPQARDFATKDASQPLGGFGVTRNARSERYFAEALKPSADAKLAIKIIEKVLVDYPQVDRKRVYITGLSQGGFGTWSIILTRPDMFAAAVPIAGGGDPALMSRLVNMPLWAFHAADDPVIPVSYSRNSVAALRMLGGKPRYTEYPSGTFFDPYEHFSWVYAYDDASMREWLFQQSQP